MRFLIKLLSSYWCWRSCRPVEWSFVRGLLEKRIASRFTMIFDNALPQTFFEAHAVLVQLAKIEKEAVGLASLHGDVLPARHTILSAALKSLFGCIYLRELTNDQCHLIRAKRALCFCWPGPVSRPGSAATACQKLARGKQSGYITDHWKRTNSKIKTWLRIDSNSS